MCSNLLTDVTTQLAGRAGGQYCGRAAIGLYDIRGVPIQSEDQASAFVPVLPFGFDGNHEAKAIESCMKDLVLKEASLAASLRQLRNASVGLHRCSSLRQTLSQGMAVDKRMATYRFIQDCCFEEIGCHGLPGLPNEALGRLWLISANGSLYVCISGKGIPNLAWAISWQTELPIHFCYTGTKAMLPAWSAGLWARAASMCDHLFVV